MKLPKRKGSILSWVIRELWLWDLSRHTKKQSKETDRQMKKRGHTTYQELWADEDYRAHLIAKAAKQEKRK